MLPFLLLITPLLSSSLQTQILGVALRPEAAEIVAKIELSAQKTLAIRRSAAGNSNWRGFISDMGDPVIEVPAGSELTEERIVHELFHIERRIQEFPVGVGFQFYSLTPKAIVDAIDNLRPILESLFLDTIEHFVIFRQMAEMGLDPYATSRAAIREQIASDRLPVSVANVVKAGNPVEGHALWSFRIAIEAADSNTVAVWDKSTNANPEGLRKGKGLAQIVTSRRPETPGDVAETIVAGLNCLLGDLGSFTLSGWLDSKKGNVVEKSIVVLAEGPTGKDSCAAN